MSKIQYLKLMSTPDVRCYLERGGETATIPIGSVEMYGPFLPVGTDSILAEAFCTELVQKLGGVVFPTLDYTWAGSSDGFPGTITMEPEWVISGISQLIVKAWITGFRRILLVSFHHTNHYPIYIAIRRIFETKGIPVLFLEPMIPMTPPAEHVFPLSDPAAKQNSLFLVAASVLGIPVAFEPSLHGEGKIPPAPASQRNSYVAGTGFFMQDLLDHAAPSPGTSINRGREFWNHQLKGSLSLITRFDSYRKECGKRSNKGSEIR